MKRYSTFIIIFLVAILVSSCSATPEEMAQGDPSANTCEPLKNIIDYSEKEAHSNVLAIPVYDSNGVFKKREGIIQWMSEQIINKVRTASLIMYVDIGFNLDFRYAFTMMMVLAVILYSASVLLGMVQANGYNALMFILKLIIIYQLSVNYFYFYTYVIQSFEALVSDGMAFASFTFSSYLSLDSYSLCLGLFGQACDVFTLLQQTFFPNSNINLNSIFSVGGSGAGLLDKAMIFPAMDHTLSILFDVRWFKLIMTLSLTGLQGVLWAAMLFACTFAYLAAVIISVKTILFAYIARYVLYGMGPIFISFLLFRETKSLFDGWLQQLISFSLQPVFVMVFLGMFQSMIDGMVSQIKTSAIRSHITYEEANYGSYIQGSSLCVKYDKIIDIPNSDSDRYWWRICQSEGVDVKCGDSVVQPYIPIDLWMLMATIVLCYIMANMCIWCATAANQIAGGARSLSEINIMGYDRIRDKITSGTKQALKKTASRE